jgi:hypothetical protein
MIEPVPSPDGVLAFRAVGRVEKADYDDVLEPAVDAMVADRGELRLVYVLGEEFEGYAASAGLEDAKLGIGHLSKWRRIAVVTDRDWVRNSVAMLGWMMPGDVRTFDTMELEQALRWAAADD